MALFGKNKIDIPPKTPNETLNASDDSLHDDPIKDQYFKTIRNLIFFLTQ